MINLMINCLGKQTVHPRGEGTQNNFELGDSHPHPSQNNNKSNSNNNKKLKWTRRVSNYFSTALSASLVVRPICRCYAVRHLRGNMYQRIRLMILLTMRQKLTRNSVTKKFPRRPSSTNGKNSALAHLHNLLYYSLLRWEINLLLAQNNENLISAHLPLRAQKFNKRPGRQNE